MPPDSLVKLPAALVQPVPVADARYVMGIDGGATKTLAAVLDLHTRAFYFAPVSYTHLTLPTICSV